MSVSLCVCAWYCGILQRTAEKSVVNHILPFASAWWIHVKMSFARETDVWDWISARVPIYIYYICVYRIHIDRYIDIPLVYMARLCVYVCVCAHLKCKAWDCRCRYIYIYLNISVSKIHTVCQVCWSYLHLCATLDGIIRNMDKNENELRLKVCLRICLLYNMQKWAACREWSETQTSQAVNVFVFGWASERRSGSEKAWMAKRKEGRGEKAWDKWKLLFAYAWSGRERERERATEGKRWCNKIYNIFHLYMYSLTQRMVEWRNGVSMTFRKEVKWEWKGWTIVCV